MTKNLDYLETLGVKVLYLTSIYEQPEMTTDIGYDIINFTNVDPLLGNLTHFDELVIALQEKGKLLQISLTCGFWLFVYTLFLACVFILPKQEK